MDPTTYILTPERISQGHVQNGKRATFSWPTLYLNFWLAVWMCALYTRPFFYTVVSISYLQGSRYFFPRWYSGIGIALCINVYNFFPLIWLSGSCIVLHYLVFCFLTIVVYVYFYVVRICQGWFCKWPLGCWISLEVIIIIIIIIDLITLLRICLLGNLHQSQTISGSRLREGKDIHSIP